MLMSLQMFLHSLGYDDDAGRWRSGVWDVTSKTSSPRYKHFKDAEDDNDKSTYSNLVVPWLTSAVSLSLFGRLVYLTD